MEFNQIICSDAYEFSKTLPNDSIDMVITSPPYNIGLYGYDNFRDDKDYKKYIGDLKNLFKQIYFKMKKGGRIAIIIGEGKNGRVPTHIDISQFMIYDLRYLPMSTIIWNKNNVSSRTAWGTFNSPLEPSLPTPFEYILVFAKELYKLQDPGESDIRKNEFIEWSLAHWTLPRSAYKTSKLLIKNKLHPAPFPEDIPTRLIKMFSWIGATIYDPFIGTGTTAIAAKKCNRNFIGVDQSEKYCILARKRIKQAIVQNTFSENEVW